MQLRYAVELLKCTNLIMFMYTVQGKTFHGKDDDPELTGRLQVSVLEQ